MSLHRQEAYGRAGWSPAAATAAEAYRRRMEPALNGDGPPAYRGEVIHTATMSAVCLRAADGRRTVVTVFVGEERQGVVRRLHYTGIEAQLFFDTIAHRQAGGQD